MIVIDMEMPKCWDDCRFNYGCECSLTDTVCSDETSGENGEIPIFCPIKCNIDDIKAEIQQVVEEEADDKRWSRGLHYALKIIDKYISGKEQG